MISDANARLDLAEISPGRRYHKQGARVMSELLKKGFLSADEYIELTGREIGRKLLEANVFAFHYNSRQVTFQSSLMKRCCEEKEVQADNSGQFALMAGLH